MNKIKAALYRFMYGRYGGGDTLNRFLLWCYVGVVLAQMIVFAFVDNNAYFTMAFTVLSWALVGTIFFRILSKNIAKRRRENEKFTGFFKLWRNKIRDRKTHVYRRCPSCHVTLRLPKAKGKHTVVCPKCKNRFQVKG